MTDTFAINTLTTQLTQYATGIKNFSSTFAIEQMNGASMLDSALQQELITPAQLTTIYDQIQPMVETLQQQATVGFNALSGVSPSAIGNQITTQLDGIIGSLPGASFVNSFSSIAGNVEGIMSKTMADMAAPFNVLKGLVPQIPSLNIATVANQLIPQNLPTSIVSLAATLQNAYTTILSVEQKMLIKIGQTIPNISAALSSLGDVVGSALSSLGISPTSGLMNIGNITSGFSFPFPPGVKDTLDTTLRNVADIRKIADNVTDLPSMGGAGILNLTGNTPNMMMQSILSETAPFKQFADEATTELTDLGQTLQNVVSSTESYA